MWKVKRAVAMGEEWMWAVTLQRVREALERSGFEWRVRTELIGDVGIDFEVADGGQHAGADGAFGGGGVVGGAGGGGLTEDFDEGGAEQEAVADEGVAGSDEVGGQGDAFADDFGVVEEMHGRAVGDLLGEGDVGGARGAGHELTVSLEVTEGVWGPYAGGGGVRPGRARRRAGRAGRPGRGAGIHNRVRASLARRGRRVARVAGGERRRGSTEGGSRRGAARAVRGACARQGQWIRPPSRGDRRQRRCGALSLAAGGIGPRREHWRRWGASP